MADAATTPDPKVEAKARGLGWVPEAEFRGDKAKWVDAPTFVQRGEEIMPILRENNRRLEGEVETLRAQVADGAAAIKESQTAMQDLIANQTAATLTAVKDTKARLRASLRAAREANDFDLIEEIEDQLDDVRDTERKIEAKPKTTPAPSPQPTAAPAVDPEWAAWQRENSWFGKDKRRTALTMAEAAELREDPANKGLMGRAFYDKAAEAADLILNPKAAHSKVETNNSSATPAGDKGGGGKKSYADLPADAKAACDSDEKKLVGKNKAFKDQAAWRAHYVEQFFLYND